MGIVVFLAFVFGLQLVLALAFLAGRFGGKWGKLLWLPWVAVQAWLALLDQRSEDMSGIVYILTSVFFVWPAGGAILLGLYLGWAMREKDQARSGAE